MPLNDANVKHVFAFLKFRCKAASREIGRENCEVGPLAHWFAGLEYPSHLKTPFLGCENLAMLLAGIADVEACFFFRFLVC
jgi:hypothetical protein